MGYVFPILEQMNTLGITAEAMGRFIGKDHFYTARLVLGVEKFPDMETVETMARMLGWTTEQLIRKAGLFKRNQMTVYYWCDARRNWKCKKTMCAYGHGPEWEKYGCKKTKDPMFAKRDEHGDVMKAPTLKERLEMGQQFQTAFPDMKEPGQDGTENGLPYK